MNEERIDLPDMPELERPLVAYSASPESAKREVIMFVGANDKRAFFWRIIGPDGVTTWQPTTKEVWAAEAEVAWNTSIMLSQTKTNDAGSEDGQ